MRLESHLRDLANLPIADWPKHLKMARGILVVDLKLPPEAAWTLLQSSLAAAYICAQRINQRAQGVFQIGNRKRLCKIFARIAKCANRIPAFRRHALDRGVCATLRQETIDSETIESLIENLIKAFGKWPKTEPSQAVLRAVIPRSSSAMVGINTIRMHRAFAEAAVLLQVDYSALPAIAQRRVESALTGLLEEDRFDTADVCMTLSRALASNEKDKISRSAAGLITDYVTAIAKIWRRHGLRPARARDPENAAYRSKFHRFADLVLTSLVDPWSKRHEGDQAERLERLRETHAKLAKDIRKSVRPTPRRSDVEWLVSEDHLRRAFRGTKK
jgi:hypothetical protein